MNKYHKIALIVLVVGIVLSVSGFMFEGVSDIADYGLLLPWPISILAFILSMKRNDQGKRFIPGIIGSVLFVIFSFGLYFYIVASWGGMGGW